MFCSELEAFVWQAKFHRHRIAFTNKCSKILKTLPKNSPKSEKAAAFDVRSKLPLYINFIITSVYQETFSPLEKILDNLSILELCCHHDQH